VFGPQGNVCWAMLTMPAETAVNAVMIMIGSSSTSPASVSTAFSTEYIHTMHSNMATKGSGHHCSACNHSSAKTRNSPLGSIWIPSNNVLAQNRHLDPPGNRKLHSN
jgi:hypothetical protein